MHQSALVIWELFEHDIKRGVAEQPQHFLRHVDQPTRHNEQQGRAIGMSERVTIRPGWTFGRRVAGGGHSRQRDLVHSVRMGPMRWLLQKQRAARSEYSRGYTLSVLLTHFGDNLGVVRVLFTLDGKNPQKARELRPVTNVSKGQPAPHATTPPYLISLRTFSCCANVLRLIPNGISFKFTGTCAAWSSSACAFIPRLSMACSPSSSSSIICGRCPDL